MRAWGRWGRRLLLAGAVALVSAATAIAYVTHRERDNAFCVACHTPDGARLHGALRDRYEASPPLNLSAAHHAARHPVTCIDCHGGLGIEGRGRILGIAAWDTLKYLAGRFKEPERMTSPLPDRDCVRCHEDYTQGQFPEGGQAGGRDFHRHPDHRPLPIACVECHASHVAGDPRLGFLSNDLVRPRCQRCHKEMGRESDL